jgi:hypothetical protein
VANQLKDSKTKVKDVLRDLPKKPRAPRNLSDPIVYAVQKNPGTWSDWKQKATGKKILIATSMSGYIHGSSMDRLLALALTEKGHQVAFLLCDSDLEACQIIKFSSYKPDELLKSASTPRCGKCSSNIDKLFTPLGLPIYNFKSDRSDEHRLKIEFLNKSFEELREFKIDSVQVGMHAWAGAIRYFATTLFTSEPLAKEVLIRFLISGIRIHSSMTKVFQDFQPDTLIAHHGIYIPQGVVSEFARSQNVNLMTWTASYRKGTFIFSPDETYHYSMVTEPTSNWDSLVLTKSQESTLDKYMTSRWSGENDWIKFSDSKVDQDKTFKDKSGFYLALTSVTWDAEIHYESRAFENMRDWLVTTIEYFKVNPTQNLVIRVHPAEITSPNRSRESMSDFVGSLGIKQFPNITVIAPDSNISTYDLVEKSRVVIVYNTKTGIEAAYRNKPVVVAGESWIRGKGIGWDANNSRDYIKILDLFKDPLEMLPIQSMKAKQYAYHFFFRRMIRVSIFAKPYSSEWLFPNRSITLRDLVGNDDQNFQEILSGITELRTPIARVI